MIKTFFPYISGRIIKPCMQVSVCIHKAAKCWATVVPFQFLNVFVLFFLCAAVTISISLEQPKLPTLGVYSMFSAM